MNKTALKTASVLAFERKLSNSDGLMYSGNWEDRENSREWQPVRIQEKAVRGTISNRLKNAIQSDPLKVDAEIQKPNLQKVDVAALPFDADTLKLSFTLKVLGNLAEPSACNNPDYQAALAAAVSQYTDTCGFEELAKRYATNLINGRFLWRNRVGSENIEVHVKHANNTWKFNTEDVNLRDFPALTGDFAKLSEVIRQGLLGESYVLITVNTFAKVGFGQEVFPSQELVLKGDDNSEKSKILYQVSDVAAIHSQKIGNALRTIDTWHEFDEIGPIAVEPYGSVTNRGKAYRQPKDKLDFYSLLDAWILKGKQPPIEQQHFVIANLIRGGVYGDSEKEK